MEVTKSSVGVWEACEKARQAGSSVGFVPTMGALHEGHHALVDRARSECRFVVLSIFVNPLQFGEAADLASYPRPLDRDLELAEGWDCDLAFAPDEVEMYPAGSPQVTVDPGPLGARLEGASRPGHFRGVLTVVAKLLNQVGPCRAYFGQKDAQQLALVRRMVADLNLAAEIVPVPIARDEDGLAVSSRNILLSNEERKAALSLVRALGVGAQLVKQGQHSAAPIKAEMARRIGAEPLAGLDYVAIVDDQSWEEVEEIHAPARALVAARVGATRLIDNLLLPWEPVSSVHNRPGPA